MCLRTCNTEHTARFHHILAKYLQSIILSIPWTSRHHKEGDYSWSSSILIFIYCQMFLQPQLTPCTEHCLYVSAIKTTTLRYYQGMWGSIWCVYYCCSVLTKTGMFQQIFVKFSNISWKCVHLESCHYVWMKAENCFVQWLYSEPKSTHMVFPTWFRYKR